MAASLAARPGAARLGLAAILVVALVPAVACDLRARRIPNAVTGPAALAALLAGAVLDPAGTPERLLAAAASGGFLLAAALARPDGMGMGDVKLAAVLGLCLGGAVVVAVLAALTAATAVGAAIMVRRGTCAARHATLPFAPFLALGALIALIGS